MYALGRVSDACPCHNLFLIGGLKSARIYLYTQSSKQTYSVQLFVIVGVYICVIRSTFLSVVRTLSLSLFPLVALRSFFSVHHLCTYTYVLVRVLIALSLPFFFFVFPIVSRTKQLVLIKRERKQVASLTEVRVGVDRDES